MSENDKFDKLIYDLYQELEVPDSTPSWNILELKLQKRRQRRKIMRRLQVATGVVCASLLIGILVTNNSDPRAHAGLTSFFKKH